ncbi:cullin, putative [Bodo saltans]|uniref:Cullin, putative n=1 Tax=Bodo saltans TaxID=75058 RepID=A0A0S4KHS5_BODSA|nr:cullin, putative [Bodo saltans]|eukprot:CUI15230.1 cullin, putative [Bodo saltans]
MNIEVDRKGIDVVKAQFEAITQLATDNFQGNLNFEMRMNHYATVYNYAIGNGMIGEVEENYTRHETLYIDFQEMLTKFMLRFGADHRPAPTDPDLLLRMVKWWRHYKVIQRWATKTFEYISRYYIPHWAKMPLKQVAMSIFLEQLFRKHEIIVRDAIFDAVRKERQHEIADRELIQSAIEMYSAMGIDGLNSLYTENFFRPFLSATGEFYRKESQGWSSTDSASEYLIKAERRIVEEKTRCVKYFSMQEERKVMEAVEAALLETTDARRLLFHSNSGFGSVLAARDVDNLRRFYKMFVHVNSGLEAMSTALKERVIAEGKDRARAHAGPERDINCRRCVADFVSLHEEYNGVVQSCFSSNLVLMKALRDGLERTFNNGIVAIDANGRSSVVSFSYILATYLDLLLRQPPTDDMQIEAAFDQVISILRFVSDHDTFQQCARELLAKRLLSQTTKVDETLERQLLNRLKQRSGPHFTTHFESMMNDRVSSADFSLKFRESWGERPMPFDFHCMVLKTGVWPKLSLDDGVRPPSEFSAMMESFEAYHVEKAPRRVLKWSHSSSHATVLARLNASIKEFQGTAFQAWTLLLFNNSSTISLATIAGVLGIDLDEGKRIIMSLAKLKLVIRQDDSTPLQKEEQVALNVDFSSPHRKIVIPVAVSRISVAGNNKAAQQAEEDRKPAIDACIVRVMKSRREMGHTDLVTECISQLVQRFSPDPKLIKVRIEDLIRREYLERTAENSSVYRYLA